MVSKTIKKTPLKSIRDRKTHRRHRKRSPSKTPIRFTSSVLFKSINKTLSSCKRRLANIFSKLARIGTPNSRYKGYKVLKKANVKGKIKKTQQEEQEGICRKLFCNEKLPPLLLPEKRTVFLDLDETLVHSNADPPSQVFDFIVRPKIDGEVINYYVLKRPGVDSFLEGLASKYEVVVFTAGLKEYASLVLDRLDSKGLISHRLYRDSCKQIDGKFVKDLSDMGRDLKQVVIVDDNPHCYIFQPRNAIPIKPFMDDLGDRELTKLETFFHGCDGFEDIRDAVKQYVFRGEEEMVDRPV